MPAGTVSTYEPGKAIQMLKSRLYELELEKQRAEKGKGGSRKNEERSGVHRSAVMFWMTAGSKTTALITRQSQTEARSRRRTQ